jgi:phage terminase large subunit-like protein
MDEHTREQLASELMLLPPLQLEAMHRRYEWIATARPDQLPPDDYLIWMLMAGRGSGKTRSGAEEIWWQAFSRPERIAVLGPTNNDVRKTAFEGESGLLARIPKSLVLNYNRTSLELWTRTVCGKESYYVGYSAEEGERLRGPQHHRAWCLVGETMVDTPIGPRRIDSISPGDLVSTRFGDREVTHVSSRLAPVRTVHMVGRDLHRTKLCGSLNHPILTDEGWVPLGDLEIGTCVTGASSSVGRHGTDTEKDTTKAGSVDFIASSGRRLLEKFLTATRSIIEIATLLTIDSRILSASASQSIAGGIASRMVSSLFESTGRSYRMSSRSVSTADASFFARSLRSAYARDVSRSEPTEREQPSESAGAAERSSCRYAETTALSVVSITEQEDDVRTVYDLRVDDAHEFIANGVVVHNCDELGAWGKNGQDVWDNLIFGLRLGDDPRIVVTTTPRTTPLVRAILGNTRTVTSRASTFANSAHLPDAILNEYRKKYEGTRLGRQELYAELLEDVVGALWLDENIRHVSADVGLHDLVLTRVVVAVDPSGSKNDSIGIVVAGETPEGDYVVLGDRTCSGSPAVWGRSVVDAYEDFGADRVVAEVNYGGAMVEAVIRSVDPNVPYKEVRATRGKVVRAEPIAALYEQGRVTHVRGMTKLEEQMLLMTNDGFQGEGSPDRVDALVWALTDLTGGKKSRGEKKLAIEGEQKSSSERRD